MITIQIANCSLRKMIRHVMYYTYHMWDYELKWDLAKIPRKIATPSKAR